MALIVQEFLYFCRDNSKYAYVLKLCCPLGTCISCSSRGSSSESLAARRYKCSVFREWVTIIVPTFACSLGEILFKIGAGEYGGMGPTLAV